MVDRCLNPHCRVEFKVLSSGDLYAYERRWADTEFFWLCSTCAPRYDLRLDPDGRVRIQARSGLHHGLPPHPEGNLRLITRSARSLPPLRTVPSGERRESLAEGEHRFWPELPIRGAIRR